MGFWSDSSALVKGAVVVGVIGLVIIRKTALLSSFFFSHLSISSFFIKKNEFLIREVFFKPNYVSSAST